jgi:hypothetical protein
LPTIVEATPSASTLNASINIIPLINGSQSLAFFLFS